MKTLRFYDDNPRKVFCCDNVGPTIKELPGEKRPVDIVQLFISNELLKKIARWTNDWFQVKKASEPNKHKAPFEPITDINELKAYFGILLAVNQNIDPPPLCALLPSRRMEMASPYTGFHKVFSHKDFHSLTGTFSFAIPSP